MGQERSTDWEGRRRNAHYPLRSKLKGDLRVVPHPPRSGCPGAHVVPGGLQYRSENIEGAEASESRWPRVRTPTGRTLQSGLQGAESPESWRTKRPGPGDP